MTLNLAIAEALIHSAVNTTILHGSRGGGKTAQTNTRALDALVLAAATSLNKPTRQDARRDVIRVLMRDGWTRARAKTMADRFIAERRQWHQRFPSA